VKLHPDGFSSAKERTGGSRLRALVTRDHNLIRQWAGRHGAEPATGEGTPSGPATLHVNDGGAGIRFNFPGFSRFRPISWDEWFQNFDRYHLAFVHEEEVADRAYEYWQARGGGDGHQLEDWLQAEQELGPEARSGARYRLVVDPEPLPGTT
jgi:hypothetical protein